MSLVIVAVFFCSPLLAAAYKEPRVLSRALTIVPSGVLLAVAGIDALWSSRTPWRRPIVAGLLVLSAIQFLMWIVRGQTA
jgi:hypothetical protein